MRLNAADNIKCLDRWRLYCGTFLNLLSYLFSYSKIISSLNTWMMAERENPIVISQYSLIGKRVVGLFGGD